MGKTFRHVTDGEHQAMKNMHASGVCIKKIATQLKRSSDTVSHHVFSNNPCGKTPSKGRPALISEALFGKIMSKYEKLLASSSRSSGLREVTVKMVKKAMNLKMGEKTICRAFWAHKVYLRPFYEKPYLSTADVNERRDFGHDQKHRSPAQWNKYLHAVIDNKVFPVYLNGRSRNFAARRRVRGIRRKRHSSWACRFTKPKAGLKFNTMAKNVVIACAIGAGKVLMWHEVKGRWNGDAAITMYGQLKQSLQKAHPMHHGKFRVLEDNDPTGYKSAKGIEAKRANGLEVFALPKRSPDLNPLDFSLWAEISRRMRKQEAGWSERKKESRAKYVQRLKRTAMNLPQSYIENIIGDLHKRCQKLDKAKGGHFSEGS